MTTIYSKTGDFFKNKSGAVNTIRIKRLKGYEPVETDGGWVIEKANKTKDIKCPGCKQCFFETTDKYNPDAATNPSMLRLKKKYKDWGWEDVPQDATAGFGCLECPDCGHPIAPEGHLTVTG